MTPLHFLDAGIAVIPIEYRSKKPNSRYLPNRQWDKYKHELPCRGSVLTWSGDPFCNFAVVCGWQNLVIVDFDDPQWHDIWMMTYGASGYADTYTVSTGRGYHLYYYIEHLPACTLKFNGGEVKATGYCLIPPSIHPSGRKYQAVNPDVPIMDIGHIDEILPETSIPIPPHKGKCTFDPFSNPSNDIKQSWRILSQFPDAFPSGDGWFKVQCQFHNDNNPSAWINDNKNKFGCHACITGSLSSIDFVMRFNGVDYHEAVEMML